MNNFIVLVDDDAALVAGDRDGNFGQVRETSGYHVLKHRLDVHPFLPLSARDVPRQVGRDIGIDGVLLVWPSIRAVHGVIWQYAKALICRSHRHLPAVGRIFVRCPAEGIGRLGVEAVFLNEVWGRTGPQSSIYQPFCQACL